MGPFKRAPWRPEDVPPIGLGAAAAEIDIAYLGGDEHRHAFASLFRKAFEDNPVALGGANLVEIRAERADGLSAVTLPLSLGTPELEALALRLYDSRSERVELVLRRAAGAVVLTVTFDNPSFSLSPFAV